MAQHHPEAFDTTLQKTNVLLKAIEDRFGWDNRTQAYHALRGVLHTLRDRLPPEHAAKLGAQLPMLVRGIYYEGWDPSHKPLKMDAPAFVNEVERQIDPMSFEQSTEEMIRGVVAVVQDYTDPNEVRKVKSALPADIRDMLGAPR